MEMLSLAVAGPHAASPCCWRGNRWPRRAWRSCCCTGAGPARRTSSRSARSGPHGGMPSSRRKPRTRRGIRGPSPRRSRRTSHGSRRRWRWSARRSPRSPPRVSHSTTCLLGFSQGACLTLEYAARHAQRYGGVVALSGGLIGPDAPHASIPARWKARRCSWVQRRRSAYRRRARVARAARCCNGWARRSRCGSIAAWAIPSTPTKRMPVNALLAAARGG